MELFDVYVAGFEVSEDRAVRGLMQVFGMSDAAAHIFVSSLPRMGKRRLSADAADRYMRALRTIGAISQCQASRPSGLPAAEIGGPSSLGPLPARGSFSPPSASLAPPSTQTSSSSATDARGYAGMPVIPKAPRLPADMSALAPAHDPPLPEWFIADPAQSNRTVTASAPAPISSAPPHTHDRHYGLSMPQSGAPHAPALDTSVPRGSSDHWAPRADHVGRVDSFAPARAGSVRARPAAAPDTSSRAKLVVVAGAIVVALFGVAGVAYQRGLFETDASRTERALRGENIDPGRYEDAQHFVDSGAGRFEGLPDAQLRPLLEALAGLGAKHVWATGIEPRGSSRVASSLVIELPTDAEARRTIFFQHARGVARHRLAIDRGQRFLQLDF